MVTVLEDEAVISVIGELDFSTAPRRREQILELLNGNTTNLVIDMSRLDFVDSSGQGVLVAAMKRMRERGGYLIFGPPRRTPPRSSRSAAWTSSFWSASARLSRLHPGSDQTAAPGVGA